MNVLALRCRWLALQSLRIGYLSNVPLMQDSQIANDALSNAPNARGSIASKILPLPACPSLQC